MPLHTTRPGDEVRARLTGVEDYRANHTLTSYVGSSYDANNRLILRSHDADGYYGTIADTTRTLYVQEMGQIVLELEKTGSWADFEAEDLTHRYMWGPGANNLLVDEAVSDLFDAEQNELRWGLTDHLGTVRDWIDSSGTVLDHAEYDSFGRRLDTPAIDAAFGFTGALVDEDTGLQNHWNRWYDPATGSWISVDPIKDGVNWYGYVGNRVTSHVDWNGLDDFKVTIWFHEEQWFAENDPKYRSALLKWTPIIGPRASGS